MNRRSLHAALIALPISLVAVPAYASQVACGYTNAGWNVPNGGIAFNMGLGPIRAVLSAVGEFRTHSMLSHGPGGYVTHATMKEPSQNTTWPDFCYWPINRDELANGYPGVQQVSQGGIYGFLYGDTEPNQRTIWMGWQLGDYSRVGQNGDPGRAAAIANFTWWNMPFEWDGTEKYIYFLLRDGARIPYSLFQYRTIEGTNVGGGAWNNGMVCSTFLSYVHAMAGMGVVDAHTYSHDQIASAIDSLYSSVRDSCIAKNPYAGIACPFDDVCGNAADLVVNCMATHDCYTSNEALWQGVRNDPVSTATSISPDRLAGAMGHPRVPAPGTSTWSADYNHDVFWNSGGSVYGCWY